MSALLPSDDVGGIEDIMPPGEKIDAVCRDRGVVLGLQEFRSGNWRDSILVRVIIAAWNRRAAPVGELTADCTKALPDGAIDDTTFEQIEDALDRAEAPCTDSKTGKWLTLPERVAALAPSLPSQEDVARIINPAGFVSDRLSTFRHRARDDALTKAAAIFALMGQTGGGWQKCATEGCEQPATVYFERGGVGSHYCQACYMRIQALPAAPAKEGR